MDNASDADSPAIMVESASLAESSNNDVVDGVAAPDSYQPVIWHWFYLKEIDKTKRIWKPFSMLDSVALEEIYHLLVEEKIPSEETIVATDGGRYDVDVARRQRSAVYWEEAPSAVRRCSWFFKGSLETRYTPYEEEMAEKLEEEYHNTLIHRQWRRILEFPLGNKIMFQNPNVLLDFSNYGPVDDWTQVTEGQIRPLIVKRGIEGFDIVDGEKTVVDHLVFLVHGIGSVCDLRFRTVVEVVDDFRVLSYQMLDTHFPSAVTEQRVGRIEFLPVSWHAPLHGDDTGIDKRLQPITLPSIPKLRHFANDTILDVLFYTSPVYCETIISTVAQELNRLYKIFIQRNPAFNGEVSLGGHSLGSLILFDLLAHQPTVPQPEEPEDAILSEDAVSYQSDLVDPTMEEVCQVLQLGDYLATFKHEQFTFSDLLLLSEEDLASLGLPMGPRKRLLTYLRDLEIRRAKLKQEGGNIPAHNSTVSYTIGLAGTGQPSISYPLLEFHPAAFYALGSPTAMFVTVRGIDRLGEDFVLPTCPRFYNIFHPYDPVAYRFETLIDVNMVDVPPVLIPHHKGRKRMHIELRETMARFSADIKERFFGSVRSTWSTMQNLTSFRSNSHPADDAEMEHPLGELESKVDAETPIEAVVESVVHIGKLNGGRRIDYVLQEAPLESFNEYLFALTSHVGYWESEDTMLMMLRETYAIMGIFPDKQLV